MQTTITISLQKDAPIGRRAWLAEYSGEGAGEIIEAFGTPEIPTAFTEKKLGGDVAREIQILNPKAVIILRD
jgi:hypothetical protein